MSSRVVVINGSPKGEKSMTRKAIDLILNKSLESCLFKVEYLDSKELNIINCCGCLNCFDNGKCPLDKKDDMHIVKQTLLKADAIILGTPIYAGNVTAYLKTIIDRISYWMHLMCLCGKPVLLVTTSAGNGVHFIKTYLSSLVHFLGGCLVDCENFTVYSIDDFYDEDIQKQINNASKILVESMQGIKIIPTELETVFKSMKKNMRYYENDPNFEYNFWLKNCMFEFDSFKYVINNANSIINNFLGEL